MKASEKRQLLFESCCKRTGLEYRELAAVMKMSTKTLERRRKDKDTLTVGELKSLAAAGELDDYEIVKLVRA